MVSTKTISMVNSFLPSLLFVAPQSRATRNDWWSSWVSTECLRLEETSGSHLSHLGWPGYIQRFLSLSHREHCQKCRTTINRKLVLNIKRSVIALDHVILFTKSAFTPDYIWSDRAHAWQINSSTVLILILVKSIWALPVFSISLTHSISRLPLYLLLRLIFCYAIFTFQTSTCFC